MSNILKGLATSGSSGMVDPYSVNGVVYGGTTAGATLTSKTNFTGGTARQEIWTRNGPVVSVVGVIDAITITTSGSNTSVILSVPVATGNFSDVYQAAGVVTVYRGSGTVGVTRRESAVVSATSGAQTVLISLPTTGIASAEAGNAFYYTYSYKIQ